MSNRANKSASPPPAAPLSGAPYAACVLTTSHSLQSLSDDPVSSLVELKLISQLYTDPWCPLNVPSRSPFSTHHTLGLLSFAHVNRRSPSRLYFTIVSGRV